MFSGAHSIIMSTDPDADRAFFRDVLKLNHVDTGGGWLIFGLPPAELAVHPGGADAGLSFYLMCDDINKFVAQMDEQAIVCEPVKDMGWGLLSTIDLPGGSTLGVYEPRHPRPQSME